jgi:stage II sporulation protein D
MVSKHKPFASYPLGPSTPCVDEPHIAVGIMDRQALIAGRLDGPFYDRGAVPLSGPFWAKATPGDVMVNDAEGREIARSPSIKLIAGEASTFTLFHVTIGNRFHWERAEDQTFQGSLILKPRDDGTLAVINEILLERYLKSVISSEMSSSAPMEFLKAHAILSRSWLLAALAAKNRTPHTATPPAQGAGSGDDFVTCWYDREDHDIFDVCADDHCQRYQGITKILSAQAGEAVGQTRGVVITYDDNICDARYSKACGGITENFETAWGDRPVPYLVSLSDSGIHHSPIRTEEDAAHWILSEPEAYCNTKDSTVLDTILPDFDRETKGFFRWTIAYSREELEEIVREKSGIDFGLLKEIVPLRRGPSGRIWRLKIVGSKRSVVVGKELEIRRWLSRSHLYSSAFIVETLRGSDGEVGRFILHGAGWGHGVGLCQIGAAVMAAGGFSAEQILHHYFRGTDIRTIY